MRWSAVVCALACACACACAVPAAGAVGNYTALQLLQLPGGLGNSSSDADTFTLTVSGVSFESGASGGAALAALACAALAGRGVRARSAPPASACVSGAPDAGACLRGTLAALARGTVHAALVPTGAAAAPAPARMRDAGLDLLGDAAPPAHRACFARPTPLAPAPRSLLDFRDARLAARYHISRADLDAALLSLGAPKFKCDNSSVTDSETSWCGAEDAERATLLVGDEAEAAVMRTVIRSHGLHARARTMPAGAMRMLAALASHAALLCGRALDATALASAGAWPLGPPPCLQPDCPFEARRLLKLVNARALARSPSAARVLGRLALDEAELRVLEQRTRAVGAEAAARGVLARHAAWAGAPGEVRAVAMLPLTTQREAYVALALRAAAELAEEDEALAGVSALDFKVELLDDACSGTRAFKYLTDALGTEFGALSGVAGPACGAAFGDVARQSAALALPVLAYTAQAPPAAPGALALLAAGDVRHVGEAGAAVLAQLGWRRVAVLTELATRAALDPARLGDVVAHLELPADGDDLDYDLIVKWAARVAAVDGRIVYVCVEDARVARAALCAGRAAGLLPARGAAWLLPASLPPRWLLRAAGDPHPCDQAQLLEAAEGHLSAAWTWQRARAPAAWADRWSARCRRMTDATSCGDPPPPHAALLYDVLRLWAAALARLLAVRPEAIDDLHRTELVRSLVEDAARVPYSGLTGAFEWEEVGPTRARVSALEVRQWRNGSHVTVGIWRAGTLAMDAAMLRWSTEDARAPTDGTERCALQGLADALHADCRVAFVATGALLLLALAALLAVAAWQCRRRAERDFRARLAALGMRTLGPKPGGLDRWELARERVVINRKLGTGAFGTVYGGHALLAEDRGWSAVAVKTLKAGASTEEKLDFLSEAEAMKRFEHKNVVRLLGVVTATEPVCTVMEFMLYGDLKGYLLARRQLAGAGGAHGAEVSPARLTHMALDVARALSYLAQLRYVHRDVAARNCLVSAHRVVKLADFGMTRLVFDHDYYRFSRKGLLPVRWMAPESLALGVFSPASDVWAFGVLLYEIVTFGSLPFQGLSNAEVLARVKAGRTLELPPGLKPQLEGLIKSCWQQDQRARPSAAAVAAFLADAPRLLVPCLDVPLDALPLELEAAAAGSSARDEAQARWVSWAAPPSAATDSTYLSAEAPRDCDAFLPPEPR